MTRITLPPIPSSIVIPPAPRARDRASSVRVLGDTAPRCGDHGGTYGQRQSVDRLIAGQDYARRLEGLGASFGGEA